MGIKLFGKKGDDKPSLIAKSRIQELNEEIEQVKEDYDPDYFLADKMFEYFQAVQQRSPKSHLFRNDVEFAKTHSELLALGKNDYRRRQHEIIWNEKSTFEEYVDASIKELNLKIEEAKQKIRTYGANEPSALQKQYIMFSKEIRFSDPLEEARFEKSFYEYIEWVANKQKDTLTNFLKGRWKPDEKKLIKRSVMLEFKYDFIKKHQKKDPMKVVTKDEALERIKKKNLKNNISLN